MWILRTSMRLGKKEIRMANTSPKGDGRKAQIRNLLAMILNTQNTRILKSYFRKPSALEQIGSIKILPC